MPKQRLGFAELAALGLALVTSGLFALHKIGFWSIWFDEAFSAYIIRFSPAEVWRYTALDVHPPLYYWLLQGWAALWGTSETALRSMSLLCLLLAIVMSYLVMRRLFDKRVALYTLVPLTLSPFLLRYAQEARMYTLVGLICMAATYVLLRAREAASQRSRRQAVAWWALYGLLVAAGMYTHYYSALVWLAHGVWLLLQAQGTWRGKILAVLRSGWTWAVVGAAVAYLPWIAHFIEQARSVNTKFWIAPLTVEGVLSAVGQLLTLQSTWQMPGWLWVCCFGLFGILALVVVRARIKASPQTKSGFDLLLLYCLLPTAVLVALSLPPKQSIFYERYISVFAVGFYLVAAAGIALVPLGKRATFKRGLLLAGLAGVLVVGIGNLYRIGNYNTVTTRQPSTKAVMAYIDGVDHSRSDPVVAGYLLYYYELFFYKQSRPGYINAAIRPGDEKGSGAMLAATPGIFISDLDTLPLARHFWYLSDADNAQAPQLRQWKVVDVYNVGQYYAWRYERL